MSTIIGGVTIRIGATTKQLEADLRRAEKAIENTANKFKSIGSKMTIGLTLPIAAIGAKAFKMASDVEESINKVEVAFGAGADEIKKFSDTTLESFGIARGSALEMASLFGDMSTSMGISQSEAVKLSKSMVGLAGDLSSFKNISVDEAQTALTGIFTGETESLKRLGVVMLDANLQAFALTQGITKQYKEFTQAEKVQLRYQYVLNATKNAQGDFARTSGGAANQLRIMQESLKEAAASLGEILLPIFTPIIVKINQLLKSFKELSPEIKNTIVTVALIVAAIGPLIYGVGLAIKAFGSFKIAMLGLIETSPLLRAALTFALGPYGILIAAAAAGILLIANNWDLVVSKMKKAYDSSILLQVGFEGLKQIGNFILEVFKNATKAVVFIASALDNLVKAALGDGNFGDIIAKSFNTADNIFGENNKRKRGEGSAILLNKGGESSNTEIPVQPIITPDAGKKLKKDLVSYIGVNTDSFQVGDILSGISKELAIISDKVFVGLITETEAVNEKTNLYKSSIQGLINTGLSPMSDEVINLQTELRKLTGPETLDIKPLDGFQKFFNDTLKSMKSNALTEVEEIKVITFDLSNTIQSSIGSSLQSIGEILSDAFTGDLGGLQGFFSRILLIIADFGSTLGKQLVALGTAKLALDQLFKASPFGAIAAGIGLIALSGVVKSIASKGIPSLAIGTDLVKQDGMAYLHKGEKVVPADVAKGGFTRGGNNEIYGKLSGIDLILSSRYANNYYNRLR